MSQRRVMKEMSRSTPGQHSGVRAMKGRKRAGVHRNCLVPYLSGLPRSMTRCGEPEMGGTGRLGAYSTCDQTLWPYQWRHKGTEEIRESLKECSRRCRIKRHGFDAREMEFRVTKWSRFWRGAVADLFHKETLDSLILPSLVLRTDIMTRPSSLGCGVVTHG